MLSLKHEHLVRTCHSLQSFFFHISGIQFLREERHTLYDICQNKGIIILLQMI